MGTVTPAVQSIAEVSDRAKVWLWTALTTTNPTGISVSVAGTVLALTVTAKGTWGASALITMQGSLDGTNWFTLKKADGNDATFSADGLLSLADLPAFLRPLESAGDGSTTVNVTLLVR